MNNSIEDKRYFLKDYIRLETDFSCTDQNLGIAPPPIEKPFSESSRRIALPAPGQWKNIKDFGLVQAIADRKSHRKYLPEALELEELAFLLWATQGVRKNLKSVVLRNVPSAGNRHAFETYLCVLNVNGLESGIYRYLPVEHELIFEFSEENLAQKVSIAAMGQYFVGSAPVVFIWAAIPYRMEWRYGTAAHKVIAIDAGHVCQNLYLACSATGTGTCAIAAYNQELMDRLIRVDGIEEFVIYLAPVGKVV
jgi:SagB-type dehydrogenase family enzyme